jgi:hypothetical protein
LAILARAAEEELTLVRRQKMEEILMIGAEALINQGMQRERLKILFRLTDRKFRAVSEAVRTRIRGLSGPEQEELTDLILDLPDLRSLEAWLGEKETVE